MTRRATTLTIALLLIVAACSSEASSGTSGGATTEPDTATSVSTTVDPGAASTTTGATATTAPLPTPPPAPTAPAAPATSAQPPVPPTTAACRQVGLNATVQRGDCGDTVTFIQERLTLLGFPVAADGQFGAGTEQVVKDFQTSRALTADGVVGEATWAALVEGGIGD